MAIAQGLVPHHHITHVNVDRRESGSVKSSRHFHVAIDALLPQDRDSGSLARDDERRSNVLITFKGEMRR